MYPKVMFHNEGRGSCRASHTSVVRTSNLGHFQNEKGNEENFALGAGDWIAQARTEL
jgi:hypothetical protein